MKVRQTQTGLFEAEAIALTPSAKAAGEQDLRNRLIRYEGLNNKLRIGGLPANDEPKGQNEAALA